MIIYKTMKEMAKEYWVHFKTIEYQVVEKWNILKLKDKDWKKLWYIDVYEANLILAQIISNLNKNNEKNIKCLNRELDLSSILN